MKKNVVHYNSSTNMSEISDNTIDLIITPPPILTSRITQRMENKI